MAFFAKREKSCCGCFSVKAGTMIIVWLFLIVAILKLRSLIEICGFLFHDVKYELMSRDYFSATANTYLEWIMWICISYGLVFQILPCILALYGTYKRKTTYLQPFILINTANIVNLLGSLLALAGTFVIVCINRSRLEKDADVLVKSYNKSHSNEPMPENANEMILTAVISIIGLSIILLGVFTLILYHFICVVHTYYLKLKEEKEDYKYNAFSNLFPENGKKPLA